MRKKSKLTITPDDSKSDNFTLSLVDYLHKELDIRGIISNKKSSYLEVALPKKYEDKYDSVVIDCDNGKIYLRGSDCKDKNFGRLSRFNPQRKSDAYNCVNYSVTRLTNRIKKLITSLEETENVHTASIDVVWIDDDLVSEEFVPETIVFDARDIDMEEVWTDIVDALEILDLRDDILDTRDCCDCECCKCKIADQKSIVASKVDEFKREHPDYASLENEYGEISEIYPDCVVYKKFITADENLTKEWCVLWSNVIKKVFNEKTDYNYKYDFELDKDNALVTIWTDSLSDCKYSQYFKNNDYKNVPGKIFFNVAIKGTLKTTIYFDTNNKKEFFHPDEDSIDFEYAGEKL